VKRENLHSWRWQGHHLAFESAENIHAIVEQIPLPGPRFDQLSHHPLE
jgi:hypothetical protein